MVIYSNHSRITSSPGRRKGQRQGRSLVCLNFNESVIVDAQEVGDSASRPVFAQPPLYQPENQHYLVSTIYLAWD